MIPVFLTSFALVVGGSLLALTALRSNKALRSLLVPTIVQFFNWHCAASSALYNIDISPMGKLAMAWSLATVMCAVCNHLAFRKKDFDKSPWSETLSTRLLIVLFALALLAMVDVAWLLDKNGYQIAGRTPYFGNIPLNYDVERTIIMVSQIIRRDFDLLYHAFWLHGAAVFVAPHGPMSTGWQNASGIFLTTGFIHYLTIFWLIAFLRRDLFRSLSAIVILFLLVFCHAEIIYGVLNLIVDGRIGSSVPNTFSETFVKIYSIRSFSTKALCLISPQHTIFLTTLGVYLGLYQKTDGTILTRFDWSSTLLLAFAMLTSPVLFAIFFCVFLPLHVLLNANRRTTAVYLLKHFALVGIAVQLVYPVLLGHWAHQIYFGNRGGTSPPEFMNWAFIKANFFYIPVLYFICSGVLAIAVCVFWFKNFRDRAPSSVWKTPILFYIPVGIPVFHLIIWDSMLELMRHQAIVLSIVSAVGLILVFPKVGSPGRAIRRLIAPALAVLAMFFHFDLLSSYGLARNWLDQSLPYKQYFDVMKRNQFRLEAEGTLSASYDFGPLLYPVAFRYAHSFVGINHYWLGPLSNEQKQAIEQVQAEGPEFLKSGNYIKYARQLGYRWIIWGPVEELTWGPKIRDSYLSKATLVDRSSLVALFDIQADSDEKANIEFFRSLEDHIAARRSLFTKGYLVKSFEDLFLAAPLSIGHLKPTAKMLASPPPEVAISSALLQLDQKLGSVRTRVSAYPEEWDETALRLARKLFAIESFTYRTLSDYFLAHMDGYSIYEPWEDMFIAVLDVSHPLQDGSLSKPIYITADSMNQLFVNIDKADQSLSSVHLLGEHVYQQTGPQEFVALKAPWPPVAGKHERAIQAKSLPSLLRKLRFPSL